MPCQRIERTVVFGCGGVGARSGAVQGHAWHYRLRDHERAVCRSDSWPLAVLCHACDCGCGCTACRSTTQAMHTLSGLPSPRARTLFCMVWSFLASLSAAFSIGVSFTAPLPLFFPHSSLFLCTYLGRTTRVLATLPRAH